MIKQILKNTSKTNKALAAGLEENLLIKKPKYADSTYKCYARKTRQLIKWIGNYPLDAINATFIEKKIGCWLKKYNGKTVNHYLEILRQVFDRAVRDGLIERSPLDGVHACRCVTREPNPFSKKEIAALLSQREQYPIEVALINVGLCTGLRISELMALSSEAVDLDRMRLKVDLALVDGQYKTPKTKGSNRSVELPQHVKKDLLFLIADANKRRAKQISVTLDDNRSQGKQSRHLFAYCMNERCLYKSVDHFRDKFFKQYCVSVSVQYRGPSQLRHTYASQLLSRGINIEWIARQLGHTSPAMIRRHYGKWLVDDAVDFNSQAERVWSSIFDDAQKIITEQPVAQKETMSPTWVASEFPQHPSATEIDLKELMKDPHTSTAIYALIKNLSTFSQRVYAEK